MFTIKKLIVLCAFSALFCGLSADAKTDTQTANKPNKPNKPGGYGVSTTTGWRKIDGWQKSVIDRDPNLGHWSWLGMREMEKSYVRLRPGQRDLKRPSRYVKPVALRQPKPHVAHYMGGSSNVGPAGGMYTKPLSVPLPSRERVATNARLRAPSTSISLAAPRTNAALAVPSTSIKLAAPSTRIRLAAPETHAQLASANTNIRLTVAKPIAPMKKPQTDAMSDCGDGSVDDTFESPDLNSNPYGPRRHGTSAYGTASANVKAKLVKKHR